MRNALVFSMLCGIVAGCFQQLGLFTDLPHVVWFVAGWLVCAFSPTAPSSQSNSEQRSAGHV